MYSGLKLDNFLPELLPVDSSVKLFLKDEANRQEENIELIASENYCSIPIRACLASCYTNKYAEGYPTDRVTGNKGRYYGGCENANKLEEYCCNKWREVFNTDYHVNVQPHSGSQANYAALSAVLNYEDRFLALDLDNGGHLTHGSDVNFSGKLYDPIFYRVDDNGYIDYDMIDEYIRRYKPKLILVGASAYSREIDFKRIYDIINKNTKEETFKNHHNGDEYTIKYRPIYMVDMAHIAGLIAAGEHQSPFGLADIITTTTHKTLRGPRGGLIFCKPELAKKIDSAIFPGSQGGPLMNTIAAKAVCAEEACTDSYKKYIHQVVINSKAMANRFVELGYSVITGGTDNHLFILDFSNTHPNLSGKDVQDALDEHKITANKNCVPNEQRSPMKASGLRIGTPAMTTKGWLEKDFIECANKIHKIIEGLDYGKNNKR